MLALASYQEVIESMEKREGEHESNPFARATEPSKEHIVADGAAEAADEKSDKKSDETSDK